MVYKIADNITSPLGFTTSENFLSVKEGKSALRCYTNYDGILDPFCASLFTEEQRASLAIDGLTRFESMVVRSVNQALESCTDDILNGRTVLILSTTKGNIELIGREEEGIENILPGLTAQKIAHCLKVKAEPIVVCNACISGLAAIILAQRLLETNAYDYAMVCGVDCQNTFTISGFQSLKAVSASECCPFDLERLGLNLGEAVATIVLGRGEDSNQDNVWHIADGVIRNDAFHISSPSKKGDGAYLALKAVTKGLSKDRVAFVNAHGTATMFNDQMESVAIERAGLNEIPVNAYKGYFGHTLGAAGVLETILSMHAIDNNTILGTRGFDELGVSGKIKICAENKPTENKALIKMISGFGGGNAAVYATKSIPVSKTCQSPLFSQTHSVTITPTSLIIDGKAKNIEGEGVERITTIYKQYIGDYPKFYKMDMLCRLGFVASELLLITEGKPRFTECEDRAIVFFNRSSSYDSDKKYSMSIGQDNYYPSPSVFVYTLPNIVTGEIAMRNHYQGETSFFILAKEDEELMRQILVTTSVDQGINSVVTGWLDYIDDNNYKAELKIITIKR